MTPNPTPTDTFARPCPMCMDTDEACGVIRVWTREKFGTHVRDFHPGFDPVTLWKFPLPNRKARG